jgi:hypothetical protein
LGRAWLKAPGWPLNTVAVLAGLAILAGESAPGGYAIVRMFTLPACLVIGTAWFVRLAVGLLLARHYRQSFRRQLARWRPWTVAPLVALVITGLLHFRAPLYVTFWLSRGEMEDLVWRKGLMDQWVGGYYAQNIRWSKGSMRFEVGGTSRPLQWHGFAYSPSGPPPATLVDSYEPLGGSWYVWHVDWW